MRICYASRFELTPNEDDPYKQHRAVGRIVVEFEPIKRTILYQTRDRFSKEVHREKNFHLSMPYLVIVAEYSVLCSSSGDESFLYSGVTFVGARKEKLTSFNHLISSFLCLPNVGEDFTICMGESVSGKDVTGFVKALCQRFWNTSFNSDIGDRWNALLKWEEKTKENPLFWKDKLELKDDERPLRGFLRQREGDEILICELEQ